MNSCGMKRKWSGGELKTPTSFLSKKRKKKIPASLRNIRLLNYYFKLEKVKNGCFFTCSLG